MMPTVYVDRPFRDLIREEQSRIERELRDGPNDEVRVSEVDGLENLLSEEAKRRLERKRD